MRCTNTSRQTAYRQKTAELNRLASELLGSRCQRNAGTSSALGRNAEAWFVNCSAHTPQSKRRLVRLLKANPHDPNQWTKRIGKSGGFVGGLLRTYRAALDIDDILPNTSQPRMGPKEDPELRRQIKANEDVKEPLFVEPHPDLQGKYRIIDGDRRWTNSRVLVDSQKKRSISEPSRPKSLIVHLPMMSELEFGFISIGSGRIGMRRRRKWLPTGLVDLLGRASAANILGLTYERHGQAWWKSMSYRKSSVT